MRPSYDLTGNILYALFLGLYIFLGLMAGLQLFRLARCGKWRNFIGTIHLSVIIISLFRIFSFIVLLNRSIFTVSVWMDLVFFAVPFTLLYTIYTIIFLSWLKEVHYRRYLHLMPFRTTRQMYLAAFGIGNAALWVLIMIIFFSLEGGRSSSYLESVLATSVIPGFNIIVAAVGMLYSMIRLEILNNNSRMMSGMLSSSSSGNMMDYGMLDHNKIKSYEKKNSKKKKNVGGDNYHKRKDQEKGGDDDAVVDPPLSMKKRDVIYVGLCLLGDSIVWICSGFIGAPGNYVANVAVTASLAAIEAVTMSISLLLCHDRISMILQLPKDLLITTERDRRGKEREEAWQRGGGGKFFGKQMVDDADDDRKNHQKKVYWRREVISPMSEGASNKEKYYCFDKKQHSLGRSGGGASSSSYVSVENNNNNSHKRAPPITFTLKSQGYLHDDIGSRISSRIGSLSGAIGGVSPIMSRQVTAAMQQHQSRTPSHSLISYSTSSRLHTRASPTHSVSSRRETRTSPSPSL